MSQRSHKLMAWSPVFFGVLSKICVDWDNQQLINAAQLSVHGDSLSQPLAAQLVPFFFILWATSSLLAAVMTAYVILFNREKMRIYLFACGLNVL
jgi:hypothetical protein